MPKHRKIDFSTWSIEGYGNDCERLGGYVCLLHALQMWCKIILAALLAIRELYSMKWRLAIYGPNSKNTNIAGLNTARGPDFVSRLYSCPQPTAKVWAPRPSDFVRSSSRNLWVSFRPNYRSTLTENFPHTRSHQVRGSWMDITPFRFRYIQISLYL